MHVATLFHYVEAVCSSNMHRIYTYITEVMLTIYSVVLREAFIYQNKSVVMSRVENGDQSKREREFMYTVGG